MDKIVNFSVPHLSEHIFEFLDDDQLVQCRSVSLTWRALVDEMIVKCWRDNLIRAFGHRHLEIVKVLVDHIPDLNAKGQYGFTPLIAACKHGRADVVKILLKIPEIDFNLEDNSGKTAFMWACRRGHVNVVRLLLSHSYRIDLNKKDQQTEFMMACQYGHVDVVQLLYDHL